MNKFLRRTVLAALLAALCLTLAACGGSGADDSAPDTIQDKAKDDTHQIAYGDKLGISSNSTTTSSIGVIWRPSTITKSFSVTLIPGVSITFPFTSTRPSPISLSATRRASMPQEARKLIMRKHTFSSKPCCS